MLAQCNLWFSFYWARTAVGVQAEVKAQAELEGIPPTQNKVAVSAIYILRIKDGQVVEEIENADMPGLYQQLGMEFKPKAPSKQTREKVVQKSALPGISQNQLVQRAVEKELREP